MDAHLFRLFAHAIEPLLEGARIEKIQAPAPDILSIGLYAGGRKMHLFFRFSRKEPFCFASSEKLGVNAPPSAQIMRIRRYFGQKRIAGAVFQYFGRKLWLLAPASPVTVQAEKRAVWLCLDLAHGASLHFLEPTATPEPDEPVWPQAAELPEALQNWREWPVLTPPLRKTLAELPVPEQLALLEDLRHGGGDVFLYETKDESGRSRVEKINAWPLPANLRKDRLEWYESDILDAFEKAGQDLVMARLHAERLGKALAPVKRRANRIRKLLPKLDADESRLLAMRALEPGAAAIRDNLWRWPANHRASSLVVEDASGAKREIILDPRHTVRENMSRLFHEASRARRGLKMLYERRKELLDELRALEGTKPGTLADADVSDSEPQAVESARQPDERDATLAALRRTLPKNVALFISSDGYTLLMGKDAKGNDVLRRMSAPHDLWAHVREGTGAHVIIRRPHPGHEIPDRTLDEAGGIAAAKSWLCNAGSAEIMYAEVRHIKPARNGPPGKMIVDKLAGVRNVKVDASLLKRLS